MRAIGSILFAGFLGIADPVHAQGSSVDLNAPLSQVVLKDGRVLHHLQIVAFGSSTVMAKWDGGRGTLAYDALPDDIRKAAELRRATASSDRDAAPEPEFPLTAARKGFVTHLVRSEAYHESPAQPPPGILNLASYIGPLGSMAAYVSPSPGDGVRHPAIIWIVGGRSNSISPVAWEPQTPDNDQSASGFRPFGIIMMYPSLRGGNDSPGFRERFFGEVADVMAAGRYLAQLNYVDPKRIYLGGHSTGGTLALLVAESSAQFRSVFSLGAVSDMGGYTQDDVPFDLSNPKESELRSPIHWLDSIRVPTYAYEGVEPSSNIWDLRTLSAANRNPLVHFKEIPKGNHFSIVGPLIREIAEQIVKDNGK